MEWLTPRVPSAVGRALAKTQPSMYALLGVFASWLLSLSFRVTEIVTEPLAGTVTARPARCSH